MIDTSKFPDNTYAQSGISNYYNEPEYEYLGFSQFIQGAFLGSGLTDTGNFRTVNAALIPLIAEKIQKHPHIWKWFFRIK